MGFAQPLGWVVLGLVSVLMGLWVWALGRRRRDLRRFVSPELVGRVASVRSLEREFVKALLVAAGLVLLSLSLARPQWGMRLEPMVVRGLDVMIMLDASESMRAEDLQPSRLARAKAAAAELMERLPLDRIGVVAFAGSAEVECPLTQDHEGARMFLDAVDPGRLPVPGTAIGEAIRAALGAFSRNERRRRVMVLITDGEDHEEAALDAAREAAGRGVVIYTVGVGSGRGEPVPLRAADGALRGYKKDDEGRVITSRLDEALLAGIARRGRGHYYRLSGDQREIGALAKQIAAFERHGFEAGEHSRREDRYQVPLAGAVLALAVEALIADRRGRGRLAVGERG